MRFGYSKCMGGASSLDDLIDVNVSDATNNEILKYNEALNVWEASPIGSVAGVNGGVFITDVYPSSGGNVGDKTYLDSVMLDSCTTDTDFITAEVIAVTGHTHYKPFVSIDGNNVSLSEITDKPLFTGTINIDLSGASSLTVIHEDGAEHTITINRESPPEILSSVFTGGYPGSQTELKENDTYDIYVESDVPIVNIEIDNYGAYKSLTQSVSSGNIHVITGTIADRGDVAQNLGARVRVQKSTGSWSDWYETEDYGSLNGTNLVTLNNLYPSIENITQSNITYPSGQEAIKDSESVAVHSTCSDFDNITYDSPNGQLNIPSVNTYEENKANVLRASGDYNISTDNYRISANRVANDATTTKSGVVYIAHADPEITITEDTYLRSGGNDGTSIQNHTITLTSNQSLISAPTIDDPPVNAGTWSGSFSGGPTVWTRTLQVHDDDIKGSYSYGNLEAINLANKTVSTYAGDNNYTLRGFVSRDIALPAFAQTTSMNVEAVSYSNVTLTWSAKSLPNKRAVGTTATPDSGSWALDSLNSNPTTIRILDTAATDAQSQESTITIEEAV